MICPNCGEFLDNFSCDEDESVESPKELLKVTVTFAFCPKNADRWDEEIQEAINRWARTDLQTDVITTVQGDSLCQIAARATRTNDWEHMDAFQCGDGRWVDREGVITEEVPA